MGKNERNVELSFDDWDLTAKQLKSQLVQAQLQLTTLFAALKCAEFERDALKTEKESSSVDEPLSGVNENL